MNRIHPHRLWIGHAGDGRDLSRLYEAGIRALVQLAAEEPPVAVPRDLIYCRFPLLDGLGSPSDPLELAVGTVAALVASRTPTLVTCAAGMSRSPAVVAAALARLERRPVEECLDRLARDHRCDVSPALWHEITTLSSSPPTPERTSP
jgi:protein-tyrosine phosphatase